MAFIPIYLLVLVAILVGASIFGYFFTLTHVTQDLVAWVGTLPASRWVIITLILCGYIVLGSFMDQIAILVLIILFIQKRPRGLFALRGRAVEA